MPGNGRSNSYRVCERCAQRKCENLFSRGETVCQRCRFDENKGLTDMQRARIVADKIIERMGWQFATDKIERRA